MSSTKRTPDEPGRGSVATGQSAEAKDGGAPGTTADAAGPAAKGAGNGTAKGGTAKGGSAKGGGNGAAAKGAGTGKGRSGPADGGAAEARVTGSDTPPPAGKPSGPVPGGATTGAGAPATPPSEAATAQFRVPAPGGAAAASAPAAGQPAPGHAPRPAGAPAEAPAPDRPGSGAPGSAAPAADSGRPAPPAAATATTPIATSALAASAAPPAPGAVPTPAPAPTGASAPEAPTGSRGSGEPVLPTLDPVPAPAVPAPGPAAAHPPPWRRMSGPDGGRSDGAATSAPPDRLLDDGPTAFLEAPRFAPSGPSTPGGGSAVTDSGSWARVPRSRPPRQAALQLKRLDPWSVLKLALVLAVVLFFIWLVAIGVLYGALDGMGVWDRLNGTYADLVSGEAQTGDTLISAGRVFGLAAVVGAINSLLFAVTVTVGAFVYNVSADLVGGIEVTLSERD